MTNNKPIRDTLDKLDWIARLSKGTCPEGVPHDPDAVRTLLNRIVKEEGGFTEKIYRVRSERRRQQRRE